LNVNVDVDLNVDVDVDLNVNVDVDLNVTVDVDLNVNVDADLNVNIVIPIRKNECRVEVLVSSVLTENQLSSVPQPNKRKAIYVTPPAVELCYAMTINKAQGQTTGKLSSTLIEPLPEVFIS
jgi:hypothetical protein